MFAALDSHARGIRADGDDRSISDLMCDTLVERVTGTGMLPQDDDRSQSRMDARVEVQVVIAASTLLGLDDQPGWLRGYGALPADVIRQIAQSAENTWWRRLICDPVDGRLLAMNSPARLYVGDLRIFTGLREHGCRLSSCTGPVTHRDHIRQHARGGGAGLATGPVTRRTVDNAHRPRHQMRPVHIHGPESCRTLRLHLPGTGATTGELLIPRD